MNLDVVHAFFPVSRGLFPVQCNVVDTESFRIDRVKHDERVCGFVPSAVMRM